MPDRPAKTRSDAGREATPGPRRPAWRHSMRFRAIVVVVLLIAASTGLCGVLTVTMADRVIDRRLERDASLLAEITARSLATHLGGRRPDGIIDLIRDIALDDRVAFITVTDETGKLLARRITAPQLWEQYRRRVDTRAPIDPADLNRSVRLSFDGRADLIRHGRPVWLQEGGFDREKTLAGYVTVAIRDPSVRRLTAAMYAAAIGIACLVCLLCLPLVIQAVNSFTRPMYRLINATHRLAAGRFHSPLATRPRADEVGLLAHAFDEMARRLTAARIELIEANQQLEGQVRDRTAQLRDANEKLRLQMRDKDEFIRAVTHDLNAPVRNIAGMTRMLLSKYGDDLAEDALTKLHRIAANARTESELLADLLELSRIRVQAGKRVRIDLDELVGQIVDSLSYDLEARGIVLRIETALPPLWAERNRVRQIFQNLIDNAIKYMPDDWPRREVRLGCRADAADGEPVFYVRDTGQGIDEKDHERVFQIFQRARYSGDRQAGGRGVGLASVKAIVETYGGRIWLESRHLPDRRAILEAEEPPDTGTTFYFTFGANVLGRTEPSSFSADEADVPPTATADRIPA